MPLELKIVSQHADLVGDDFVREFHEAGGTIGRSLRNDWILPDPDRFISGSHAAIDFKGGIYYLIDTSTNGVYINKEADPIGNGNPRRLFDGDRLRMGDFKFSVSVDSGESLVFPLEKEPSVAQDNIEQFVDEVSLRTGIKLLDEEEITGDEEFHSVLFGDLDRKIEPKPVVQPKVKAKIKIDPVQQVKPPSSVAVTAEDLFDSFLDGLGISRVELHPSVNRPEMMLVAGQVLREFVKGTVALLASRADLKTTFRLDQTSVLPRQNNALKFSDNTNDLLKQLLVGGEGEYLGAKDSIREVCRDLLNHQDAFLAAMNGAFGEFAERFDPDELQDGFDRTMSNNLFGFMNKAKYWQLYCDLYPIITEKGTGRFPQMFGEEFVRAYERQIAEFQRHDRDGTGADGLRHETRQFTDTDPQLAVTQKLYSTPPPGELTEEKAEPVTAQVDQSLIDALDNSLAEALPRDKKKA